MSDMQSKLVGASVLAFLLAQPTVQTRFLSGVSDRLRFLAFLLASVASVYIAPQIRQLWRRKTPFTFARVRPLLCSLPDPGSGRQDAGADIFSGGGAQYGLINNLKTGNMIVDMVRWGPVLRGAD
mmetsp:Transcript_13428/g.49931  ORF Transcript_13428/g.49931 Transcript_13428/m.49931 type:complete len:125 (+) Transcript_13428:123-497(+)|eukprot:scaffold698_cov397-Pinguiococcus_pyrenoidosus.AAC.7